MYRHREESDRLLEASADIATLRGQVTELADALVGAALWLSYDGNTLRGDGAIHNSKTDTRDLIFGSHRSQDLAEDYFRISKSWRELVEKIETSAVADKYRHDEHQHEDQKVRRDRTMTEKVTIARADQGSEGMPGGQYAVIDGRVVYDEGRAEPYMCRVTWSAGSNQGELEEHYGDELVGYGTTWEEAIDAIA